MHDYQDIPRIYTGIAQILSCFLYCELFRTGNRKIRHFLQLVIGLIFQCLFLQATGGLPLAFWIPCMVLAFGLMFLFLYWNLPMDPTSLLYVTCRAFVLAEFIASAHWQIYAVLEEFGHGGFWISVLSMGAVYALLLWLAALVERTLWKENNSPVYTWSEVLAAVLITVAVFTFSNMGFLMERIPIAITRMNIFNTRTLVDLGGLAIMYAYQLRISGLQAEKELDALRISLQTQYGTYRNYQDILELINIKLHDLKHHTLLLRSETDPERRGMYLDEMEKELAGLQAAQQTGSPVLDIILAGKSARMRNLQIQFTCVADGSLLNALHVTDICTIFGNALDNAIEHVAQISDPAKRIISMTLARRREFVYIEVSNYCEKKLKMMNGLPVTTKKDSGMHGYGLRSMIHAVRKYDGNLTIEQRDHFIEVKILIPVHDGKPTV